MPIRWPYLIGLIVLAGVAFYLFYSKIENFFVFHPQSSLEQTPEDFRLTYKDIFFSTEDGWRLQGWLFPLKEKSPLILFCHGNAGNISHRLDNIRHLLDLGLPVFIFDYRGYGRSTGRPSEKGLYKDGMAAYNYLVQEEHFEAKDIVVFGRSLGAAVAVEISLKKAVRAVIIESAFTSTKDMAKTMGVFSLISPLLPPNYNNLKKIAQIGVPKLIIHGTDDRTVPYSMGETLFNAAQDPKFFLPVKGADHNDTYLVDPGKYFKAFVSFVRDLRL